MTIQGKDTLKSYFETGDRPTQAQFENLIDSIYSGVSYNVLPGLSDYGDISVEGSLAYALSNITTSGIIQLPAGELVVNTPIVCKRACTIQGNGPGTILVAGPSLSPGDYLLSVDRDPNTTVDVNKEHHLEGFVLRDATLLGGTLDQVYPTPFSIDRSTLPDVGGVQIQWADHITISNCTFEHFRREAINFRSTVRESVIQNNHTRFCGDADRGYQVIGLYELGGVRSVKLHNGTTSNITADPHNNIKFVSCFLGYNLGDITNLHTNISSTETVRNIHFIDLFTHGVVPTINTVPYTFTTAMTNSTGFVVQDAKRLKWIGCRFNAAGYNKPYIHFMEASNIGKTKGHIITSNDFSPHYGGTTGQFPAILATGSTNTGEVILVSNWFTGSNPNVNFAPGWNMIYGSGNYDDTQVVPVFTNGQEIVYGDQIRRGNLTTNSISWTTNGTTLTSNGDTRYNGTVFYNYSQGAQREFVVSFRATTIQLEDGNSNINKIGKYEGKIVKNLTTNTLVSAMNASNLGVWHHANGVIAHTPI